MTWSRTTVPLPGNISSLSLATTSRKCLRAIWVWRTWASRSAAGGRSRDGPRGRGEDGEPARDPARDPALAPDPPGDRICDRIPRKSSLKERARRASRLPRDFPPGESPANKKISKWKLCSRKVKWYCFNVVQTTLSIPTAERPGT